MTIPATISHAVQQTQEWLKELRDNGDLADEAVAYSVLRAVLHQLRAEVERGVYFEGWRPSHTPEKVRTREKFIDGVVLKQLPHQVPPEPAVRDVFALLAHHCDPGEISDVIEQLPKEIKALWPQAARTFKSRTA